MATGTYEFYPKFTEIMNVYQPVASVRIGDGKGGENNDAGVLYLIYANGEIKMVGPVSSYAEAIQAGVAGPGTAYDTPEKWVAHIVEVTENALKAEGWAVGTQGGTAVSGGTYYHNNSKYWAEQSASERSSAVNAKTAAEQAQGKAEDAQQAAETARSQAKEYQDSAETYARQANAKASEASTSANNAATSEQNAATSKTNADASARDATQAANDASASKNNAAISEQNAAQSEQNAEAWAKGTKNGVPVESTDETYHNNSKYYSDYASNKVDEFSRAVENAVTVYQNSTSGRTPPTGQWTSDPHPENGRYMWLKTTFTWMNGSTTDMYNVSYIGANGTGSVNSVNGLGGDIILDSKNLDIDSTDPHTVTIYQTLTNLITSSQIYALFT